MSKRKFFNMWIPRSAVAFSAMMTALIVCADLKAAESSVEVPFLERWAESGHADAMAEAFIHWDGDDPAEVPTSCAKCHSTLGFQDFMGADGTAAGTVDNPAPIGSTIECVACHNDATALLDSVVFPSGAEVSNLGPEAVCMQCHQGRESTVSVDSRITGANVPDDDTVSADLGFRNVHYFAAGATQFGGVAMGGYQYAGKSYDVRFAHVEGIDTCTSCHDQHSLEVKVEMCGICHDRVATREDLRAIRFKGSSRDYDGDGDMTEGIADEIAGLQEILYSAIQAYANALGAPIVYDAHSYPYFFEDTNGNGMLDENEPRYGTWTARLVRATYNYQFSQKDPGAFAHNGKYVIQLLYDSIEDLDASLATGLRRDDAGHFAGSQEAFRHWDGDGKVSASCAKCHSGTGLPFLLDEGVSISQPLSNGLLCSTCHDSMPKFTRYKLESVLFPSGVYLSLGIGDDSNLCINCHQGRESTVSVDASIAGLDPDTVSSSIGFKNVHYLAAGATLFGTQAKGAYEYPGKTYNGRFQHIGSFNSCAECHDSHTGKLQDEICGFCHAGIKSPRDIRKNSPTDYDGDGNKTEGIAGEIDTLGDALYAAIQNYAASVVGTPIAYDSHSYPYFFIDTNGNGQVDEDEAVRSNGYNKFTPRLLKAAYNYQYFMKDPGAYAHNGKYMIQVLSASLEDISAQ